MLTKVKDFFSEDILRYPRLDTILMVEEALKNTKKYLTKTQLWKSLPKQMMYQTFSLIIDYLEYSGKIIIDKDNTIVWIWNPKWTKKAVDENLVVR